MTGILRGLSYPVLVCGPQQNTVPQDPIKLSQSPSPSDGVIQVAGFPFDSLEAHSGLRLSGPHFVEALLLTQEFSLFCGQEDTGLGETDWASSITSKSPCYVSSGKLLHLSELPSPL